MLKDKRQTYERVARYDYQVRLLNEYHHIRRIELILQLVSTIIEKEGGNFVLNVVDIGCGDGHFDRVIRKNFHDSVFLVGVDISTTRIKRAKQMLPDTSFMLADIHHLPFKRWFDVAIVAELIEHLVAPKAALEEVEKVLRKQGHLILDTPSKTNPIDIFLGLIGKESTWGLQIDKTHVAFYDETTLKSLLRSAGFHTIDVKGESFLRYDLLSLLGLTLNKRMWRFLRFVDRFAERSTKFRKMGAIQVFLCQKLDN